MNITIKRDQIHTFLLPFKSLNECNTIRDTRSIRCASISIKIRVPHETESNQEFLARRYYPQCFYSICLREIYMVLRGRSCLWQRWKPVVGLFDGQETGNL